MPYFWHSRKAQSNILLGVENGFTASTALSHKFHLKFCLLSLFVVLFVTARKIEQRKVLMPSYKNVSDNKTFG